ncbi:hypothetical protein F441_16913 [Phytophthora nicotianae CJ01A1]|uniref:3-dehydroquinate dehydratase n=4 Tax=Phytophthora nicotianae TaxID=4792 RepID=V9EDH3_PHYNI|nr:hypothetical protein F443_17054 [Phytophthora nicotianae P1569]ETM36986.1 hypothetical protein L914_16416 [Phytophthora nicotianae]ETP06781.1 hypothetical protein F441_16913 [Phytophthora nicotianae CJ01A1]
MRSARLVLALTGAGGRRGALPSRSLLLQPRAWRCLSSTGAKTPSNPFEIDLNVLKTPSSPTEKLALDDATRAATSQQTEAQHDINLLHAEMSTLFGEDVAEYGGDTSSASVEEDVTAFNKRTRIREHEEVPKERGAVQPPVTRAAQKPKVVEEISSTDSSVGQSIMRDNALVNVLLLQGPCSFVRGVWTGGDIKRKELQHQIQALADDQKIVVKHREYDSEKIILHMLLEAREDQVVVLCWNISLAKSPFVVHALGLIQSRVIIVSPNNVDHGPLPASVVGVLSGFWNQSISLALSAAANLLAKQTDFSSAKNSQNSAGIASSKKGVLSAKTKKKALTCYLCGKEGHILSKCPELPRNKV